jgi:steroid Delta-isomerase
MDTASVLTFVSDYAAAISALNVDRYVATFADDVIAYAPVGAEAFIGKAGIRQFFENIGGLFAKIDFQFTFVEIIGDEIALKWQGSGVGKNGQAVSFEGIDIWRLNQAGKIQTLHAYWNPAPVVAKLAQTK